MKKLNTILVCALAVVMCFAFAACGNKDEEPKEEETTKPEADETIKEDEEAAETIAVTPGDPEKKAILVVSFGTSYNDTRAVTIDAIEKSITDAFPEFDVRRAFTSQIIIDKLKDRDGLEIDNVEEALDRLVADDIGTLVVQPTHVMNGKEYDDIVAAVEDYKDNFVNLEIGSNLLAEDEDYPEVIKALAEETKDYNVDGNAIVLMGHGTEHPANATYATLQDKLKEEGYDRYFVGTVEATPTLEDVMNMVAESGSEKVVLMPFMIVAGDHANNDMAGDEEGSWKTEFKAEGYDVECVLKGLGEYKGIQDIIVAHTQAAVDALEK